MELVEGEKGIVLTLTVSEAASEICSILMSMQFFKLFSISTLHFNNIIIHEFLVLFRLLRDYYQEEK